MIYVGNFSSAVENRKVQLQFQGDTKTYSILWTELLVLGSEVPVAIYAI